MILTGPAINEEVQERRIRIHPYNMERTTTNSYDLTLGRRMIRYTSKHLDPREEPDYEEFEIGEEGILMQAQSFLLGESAEKLGSDHYIPLIHSRSGTARLGLFVHVTADLIDIGSYGTSTFQLYATLPVRLYPGMLIAQVSFWKPLGKICLYNGKYQGSDGPQPSRAYLNDYGAS